MDDLRILVPYQPLKLSWHEHVLRKIRFSRFCAIPVFPPIFFHVVHFFLILFLMWCIFVLTVLFMFFFFGFRFPCFRLFQCIYMFISSAIFIFSFICACCQTCNLSFVIWICVSCSLCPSVALYCLVFVSCLCLQLHSNCYFAVTFKLFLLRKVPHHFSKKTFWLRSSIIL